MSDKWTHDGLANDLASYLGGPERMIWTDMQLGPSGSMRPDVYTIRKSYTRPRPMAYEVKVSVADYRSDVTSGKWQRYLEAACGVVFAVPHGLITKADLPNGCGLMVRGESGWTTIKAPTLSPCKLSQDLLLKLLIDGLPRYAKQNAKEMRDKYTLIHGVRKKLGNEISEYLLNKEGCLTKLEVAKAECKAVRDGAQAKREEIQKEAIANLDKNLAYVNHEFKRLCDLFGITDRCHWKLSRKLVELVTIVEANEGTSTAEKALEEAISDLGRKLEQVRSPKRVMASINPLQGGALL